MLKTATLLWVVLLSFTTTANAQVTQTFTVQQPGQPAGQPFAPPRDPSTTKGTAVVRGRVVAAEDGTPLRRARVSITSQELRITRSTSTDAQGRYEIKELPAGRYNLTASKGSFVMLQYGQTRPTEPGKPLQVFDNQTIEKIDFSLPHGAVVTGKIFDEFGDPISDVMVMAMRYQYFNGRRRLVPAGGRFGTTNDIGEYRVFGLPPGQYYLSATLRSFTPGESDDRSGYAATYYPGSANVSDAQRVTVTTAQELANINFALASVRTANVSGVALDSSGKPMAGAMIMLMQSSGGNFMATTGGTQVKPDGSFVVSNLAPGEYNIRAMSGGLMGGDSESAAATVTVAGEDVTGVRLQAVPPAIISGQIVLEGAMADERVLPALFQLVAMSASGDDPFTPPGRSKIADDWTFEMKTTADRVFIRSMARSSSGWYLKSVLRDGIDVSDTGLDVKQRQAIGGIQAVFSKTPTTIQGHVTGDRDQQLRDYSVVVFPDDRERWNYQSRYISVGRPDQDGQYSVTALPPGEYLAVAVDYLESGQASDPEFLEKMRPRGTRFTIVEGETKVLDLKLIVTGS